jgi:hypothetical protein
MTSEIAIREDASGVSLAHRAAPGTLAPKSMEEALEVAKMLHSSGWFRDLKDAGQALTKIVLGAEMGVSPITAVRGIFVLDTSRGPVIQLAGDLVAKLMKAHGYTWTIDALDAEGCRLTIHHGGRTLGQVEYTAEMAKKANLLGKAGPWTQFREDMLFNRAISRAQRRYAPEVTGGLPMPVMEAEEIAAEYPDPHDDLVRSLHATYREAFPKPIGDDDESYRNMRLDWASDVLGRQVISFNGPDYPESLTRAEFQTLLDVATKEALDALGYRLRGHFGDDELAGLHFLRGALPGVSFERLADLDGKQRKAVHKALDALQSSAGGTATARRTPGDASDPTTAVEIPAEHHTNPPSLRGQAAPISPGVPAAAGAKSTAPPSSAGRTGVGAGPIGSAATPPTPAEHHTAEVLGEGTPADGTTPGGPSRSDTGQPSGPAPLTDTERINAELACQAAHAADPFPCKWHIQEQYQRREDETKLKPVSTTGVLGEDRSLPTEQVGLAPTPKKRHKTDPGKGLSVQDGIAEKQRFMDERKEQTTVERPGWLEALPAEVVYNLTTFFQTSDNPEQVSETVVRVFARRNNILKGSIWTPAQLDKLAAETWRKQ